MWNILLIEKGDESSRLLFPKLPLYDMLLQRESDASAALALLAERQYDLLLVDGDGTELELLSYLEQLRRMSEESYAVVFVTEALSSSLGAELDRYRERPVPAVILIPGVFGNTGEGLRSISRSVEQAVGSDILK